MLLSSRRLSSSVCWAPVNLGWDQWMETRTYATVGGDFEVGVRGDVALPMLDGDLGGSVLEWLLEDAPEDEVGISTGEGRQRGAGIFGAAKLVKDFFRELVAVKVDHGVLRRVTLVSGIVTIGSKEVGEGWVTGQDWGSEEVVCFHRAF